MRICTFTTFILAFTAVFPLSPAAGAELPRAVIPDSLGVNIHFTDPRPGEMEMLAEGGFRVIRMDFTWSRIEVEKGKYDFSAYDRLMAALDAHQMRALFILDYVNRHYDNGLSPSSDEGRKAFARWAAAAAQHFRGRGILWEMYNEPNIRFWRPEPKVEDYVKLALEVGKALRKVAPEEIYIGPGTSQIDMVFLEECFKAGLLEYWSGVTVHPYRQKDPETAAAEYAQLRRLIAKYAPKGKQIPILSGEWGYSSAWHNFDNVRQAKYLPRQWMINLANDIPVSIWYDWHDDGKDPKEAEHNFGTVKYPYHKGRTPVYDPKPSYLAAKTLTTVLNGFQFNKRLAVASGDDYVYLFSKGDEVRLAAWTTSKTPHAATIPASPGRFAVTSHTGESLAALTADAQGLTITLNDTPQYLVPEAANDLLRVASAWQRAPLDLALRAQPSFPLSLSLRNPLDRPIRVSSGGAATELKPGQSVSLSTSFDLMRVVEPVDVRLECRIEGLGTLAQTVPVQATNPLSIAVGPPIGGSLFVRVDNPSGEAFKGLVRLIDVKGVLPIQTELPIEFQAGQQEQMVRFVLQTTRIKDYRLGVRIEDQQRRLQVLLPPATMRLVDDFSRYTPETLTAAWHMIPDGDAKIASTQSVAVASLPSGSPMAGDTTLQIAYTMAEGWKFVRLSPKTDALRKIGGRPKALGFWIYGNNSKDVVRLRFVDSTGQTFQPSGDRITWTGWRYLEIPLDGTGASHWGGANDGVVHYPIRWDTLLLIDGARLASEPPPVYLSSPVLIQP